MGRHFQNNPAEFASKYNTYDDDGGKGPAWNYIRDARDALPSDWHEKEVTVRFTADGPIGPLKLQLWDLEGAKEQAAKEKEAKKEKAEKEKAERENAPKATSRKKPCGECGTLCGN